VAWEKRSKSSYYYRKVRVGNKVRSIYIGNDILAYNLYADAERRRQKNMSQLAEIEAEEGVERALEENHRAIMALAESVLLLNNYHLHRGIWRLRDRRY